MRGFILNATSIKVNWTNSSETNGYVIEYTTGGVMNVVSSSENEILLTDLSPISTYTISVYSYIDLPSVNSTTVTVLLSSDSKLPTDLSPISTYTISVYSYIDLPSVNSTTVTVQLSSDSKLPSIIHYHCLYFNQNLLILQVNHTIILQSVLLLHQSQ